MKSLHQWTENNQMRGTHHEADQSMLQLCVKVELQHMSQHHIAMPTHQLSPRRRLGGAHREEACRHIKRAQVLKRTLEGCFAGT